MPASNATSSVLRPKSALKRKLLYAALADPDFRRDLARAATEIKAGATLAATEATIEGYFERVLYALLRDINLEFHPEKEVHVDYRRHVGRGRMDARLGALIIEYKRPAKLRTDAQIVAAREQLSRYLIAESERLEAPTVGFLTDGRRSLELRADGGSLTEAGPVTPLDGAALLRIVRQLVALDLTALTASNLIRDFCGANEDGPVFETARLLNAILAKGSTPKTDMLRSEWEELFKLAHDDQSQQRRVQARRDALARLLAIEIDTPAAEYRALFALHTAYAIILKLMAYRVVSEVTFRRAPKDFTAQLRADSRQLRAFCAELEDGEVFRKLGILNLLEGDFFAWYSDRRQWNADVATCVRRTLEILGRYEAAASVFASDGAVDLFRDLYEATVPQVVRASFGEFYTPSWLANDVLTTALPTGRGRVLDPCCGSGMFVVAAIDAVRRTLASADPTTLLPEILNRVVGIDLNPLAVLTARVNYFIHICDLLPRDPKNVVIPIYLGDASYVPDRLLVDGVPSLSYTLRTLKEPLEIRLPMSLISDTPRFVTTMLEFEAAVHRRDDREATRLLIADTSPRDRRPSVTALLSDLASKLVAFETAGWNGIWARVITNFFTTAVLGRFDAVIGNPPWIDWKNLPATYREKIKGLCIDRGLFSGAGRTGGINLNICALIAHVSIANWLGPKGRFAFLMPRELANQPSYEGWRKLPGLGRDFLEFHDWSAAGHPFDPIKEDFMTFVVGVGSRRNGTVPVRQYRRRRGASKPRSWRTRTEAMSSLDVSEYVAGQVIPGKTAFTFAPTISQLARFGLVAGECSYLGREGIEFYPQELLLFRYVEPGPRKGTVIVENVQFEKSKYRIPKQRFPLETRYLYPLAKGPAIGPFTHAYDGLIVPFPYEPGDPHRPVPAAQLRRVSPLLLDYYERNDEVIKAQTKFSDRIRGPEPGEFYGLARTGLYSFAPLHVAFRDNSRWCAAVISETRMPWGEAKRYLFQNHAVSLCETKTRATVGEQEAHYVCAVLNAPTVEAFIYASSDERSYNIRPPVYVPEFDGKNQQHVELAALSRRAHISPENVTELRREIDRIYLALCRAKARRV